MGAVKAVNRSFMSYFAGSFVFAAIAIGAGFWLGGLSGALSVLVLSILEVSLSFDNAIVNAKVLKNWSEPWRRAFIYGGIFVAVFGMRCVFPIVIVSAFSNMGMGEALTLALQNPTEYSERLEAVHPYVTAFGGSFLLMIGLGFFFDTAKDEHWIPQIEHYCAVLGKFEAIQAFLTLGVVLLCAKFLVPAEQALTFVVSGVIGVMTFFAVEALGTALGGDESEDDKPEFATKVIKAGIGGFLYLEVLDASFSFDGVIGAFAVSNSIIVIMLGLGVGAFFVRSMTIYAVDKDTLGTYRHLEHGAFWAIIALATMMFLKLQFDIPETVTGLIGAAFILLSLATSIRANAVDAKTA